MKTTVRITASVALAAILIIALMVWGKVSPMDALATIRSLPPHVYAIALGMHMSLYCMRALRFNLLIPKDRRPSFKRSLIVAGAHNMASYLLPAKTGEASFVVYLRMQCAVPSAIDAGSVDSMRSTSRCTQQALRFQAFALWRGENLPRIHAASIPI